MTRLYIERSAADNEYLHKDFHGALSTGIEFIDQRYGDEAVRRYLRTFARSYYAPLTAEINARGLEAMREYLERTYRIEGGEIALEMDGDGMTLHVAACPAVMHMRSHGYPVARLFAETSKTVYPAICEDTPFAAEVTEYDDETGRSVVRFRRRTT